MTERRPIDAEQHLGPTGENGSDPVSPREFKEAFSYHATGVAIVAVRDGGTVHATTVSSFVPVSVAPPVVLVSVSGNAQVLPFLDEGARFTLNLLRAEQRSLATRYADSYPIGPSPFAEEGDPVIPEALASLRCLVQSVVPVHGTRVVLGRVVGTRTGGDEHRALVHYRRGYHVLP